MRLISCLLACIGVGIFGCRTTTPTDSTLESSTVSGYDKTGSFVSRPSLPASAACRMIATEFSDSCRHAGGRVLTAEKCEELCTEKVAAIKSTISGFNENGVYVNLPALPSNAACRMIATTFSDACRKSNGKLLLAERCEELCSVKVGQTPNASVACKQLVKCSGVSDSTKDGCGASKKGQSGTAVAYWERAKPSGDNKCQIEQRLIQRICTNPNFAQGDDPEAYDITCK